MKRAFTLILAMVFTLSTIVPSFGAGAFESTSSGVRYVVRDANGKIVQAYKPTYDATTGKYVVKDEENRVIAQQSLAPEAGMGQIKIIAPVSGDTHSVMSTDFLGNQVPVLRELPANDPRYIQLKSYIESDAGLRKIVAMQVQARNYKIDTLQQELSAGTRDPKLAAWLVNDLKKPVYLEIGDSGAIYHDPRGFIMAEQNANGQVVNRDNAYANRIVVPSNSEVFAGMQDSAAASVMAHEMGHMIMDQVYETPNYPKSNYAGPHSKDSITDPGFAYHEGWAEAIETLSNKDRLYSSNNWRVASQRNVAENKYVFKNQGVLEGPNDGILKSGAQMLSTEGVNASLFYKMLTDNRIQAPYSKVLQVFEQSKPQNYNEFLKSYIEKFPEDRSQVIKGFLESTKYATVDSTATARYKALHDAEVAYKNAASPELRSQLEQQYQQQLSEYNQWKEQAYKQTVVDGKIDRALDQQASAVMAYSDDTSKRYRSIKLSEVVLKGQKALGVGVERATQSIKQSFSVKNVAMTAGTSIAINLASQVINGEKPSFKKAFQAVASLQFVGNVVGSSLGAAAGHMVAPLIQTFVPIPIVGTLAGALLPTFASIAGGQFGGNLGAGVGFKQAVKNLDWVAISGQAIGSTLGAMLGAMIPVPVLGPMIGGIVGGILGEKVFKGIAKLFGFGKKQAPASTPIATSAQSPFAAYQQPQTTAAPVQTADRKSKSDPSNERLAASIDRIPYEQMHPNLRKVKDAYEKAYQDYVQALGSGNSTAVQSALSAFRTEKDRYHRALGAYLK